MGRRIRIVPAHLLGQQPLQGGAIAARPGVVERADQSLGQHGAIVPCLKQSAANRSNAGHERPSQPAPRVPDDWSGARSSRSPRSDRWRSASPRAHDLQPGRRVVSAAPARASRRRIGWWTWAGPPTGRASTTSATRCCWRCSGRRSSRGGRLPADANAVSLDNGKGGSERGYATPVTANYFAVLGTRAAAGRLFLGDEDRVPDGAPVAVISHAFWVRRFGGGARRSAAAPPGINGAALHHRRRHGTRFHGTTFVGTDLWVPFAMAPHVTRPRLDAGTAHRARHVWHLGVARLKAGVSVEQARDELNALLRPVEGDARRTIYGRWSVAVQPSARVPGEIRGPVAELRGRPVRADGYGPGDRVQQRGRHVPRARSHAPARNGHATGGGRWT